MEFGAHLPLIDFGGEGFSPTTLYECVDAVRAAGLSAIAANDHVIFQRPWLDGIVALASVLERTADMTLATTVALPVIRGPAVLAKGAAALSILSGGRFVLGVGPGSSPADYDVVGVPFDQRWPRFDAALRELRAHLADAAPASVSSKGAALEPRPARQLPIWVGSWGSTAGIRRVARLGDGWLASAYNTTPARLAAGRDLLHASLRSTGRDAAGFPIALATMWTYLIDTKAEAQAKLDMLARMLNRDPAVLAEQVLIGEADECAARLSRYAGVGVNRVFIWPLGDFASQVDRFATSVVPAVVEPPTSGPTDQTGTCP